MISLTAFNMIKAGAETNTRVFTPQKIVKEMLDALPPEVWNSKTTFLDPAVKSGVYLVEIYNRLMETPELIKDFPDEQDRAIHIYKNQLFGIAIDNFCCLMAQRNLYGHIGGESNIRFIDGYMSKVKDKDSKKYIDAVKKEFNNMKFDVVIGNPPYQETNGGGGNSDSGKAIYQHFVNKAIEISDKFVCMITKNSWYRTRDTGGNKGFDKMKDNLLAKGMLTTIVDFPKYHEIFKGIGCAVSYFVADKNKSSKQYEFITIIDNKEESRFVADCTNLKDVLRGKGLTSIANKVFNDQNMSKYTFAKLAFGIDTTGVFDLRVSPNEEYNIKLVENGGVSYIRANSVNKHSELIGAYKIICTRAVSAWSGNIENVITSIQLLKPHEVCTGTYSVIYYTNDKESAYNAEKYIKTKFVRELLRCTIDARGVISGTTFEYVPLQDFTNQSDIDWSQSISDIDKQLYKKYSLTDEEINYIEKTIKPMT